MSTSSSEGFRRQFGELLQTVWLYGDGSVDLVENINALTQVGVQVAQELGMDDLHLDEGAWRLFRPLVSTVKTDTLMLLERYDDIRVWAAGEYEAQRSPVWMKWILDDEDNEHSWIGESQFMAEDTLDLSRELESDLIAIDWVTYEPTKRAALVDFPELVRELGETVAAAGFDQTRVRYFGMPTVAGGDAHLAQLWLEHSSPSVLGEVLDWRQNSRELADWRRRLNAVSGSIRSHHLLSQIT